LELKPLPFKLRQRVRNQQKGAGWVDRCVLEEGGEEKCARVGWLVESGPNCLRDTVGEGRGGVGKEEPENVNPSSPLHMSLNGDRDSSEIQRRDNETLLHAMY